MPEWTDAMIGNFKDVDAMFVTHSAYDHIDDTIPIVELTNAEVDTEPAVANYLVSKGFQKIKSSA